MTKRRTGVAADADDHDKLAALAEKLGLTAVPPVLPDLLRQAEQEGLSYSAFGRALLGAEVQARQVRRVTRSLKRSRLGTVEGLEGFDHAARPQLEPRVIRELQDCRFVAEHRNVLCLGRAGLGKTRIAKALAHAACLKGYSVRFTSAADMLEDLHASLADGSLRLLLRRYTKPDLLLIDELDYGPLDTELAGHLFRVVAARHHRGSIVLTANSGFTKWSRLFPSEPQAVATVDRLIDQATILRFTGKSFRQPREVHGAPLDE